MTFANYAIESWKNNGNPFELHKKIPFITDLRKLLRKEEIENNLKSAYTLDCKYHLTFRELIMHGFSFTKAEDWVSSVFEAECNFPLLPDEIIRMIYKYDLKDPKMLDNLIKINIALSE